MPEEVSIRTQVNEACRWLVQHPASVGAGWGEHPGKPPSTLNTAETLIALLESDYARAGDSLIEDACEYLIQHRCKTGDDIGSWPRELHDEHGQLIRSVPDIVRTTFALEALMKAGRAEQDPAVIEGLAWVLRYQASDGGWAYRRGGPLEVMATCFALSALLEACDRGFGAPYHESVSLGLDYLTQQCCANDGHFLSRDGLLDAVHTVHAILILQKARRLGFRQYRRQEAHAIDWLLRHPDQARALMEESIEIDTERGGCGNNPHGAGCADYGFSYMTDALLIRVLVGSPKRAHQRSNLARIAMLNLRDKIDRSGGVAGNRIFTWSTAKAINALVAADRAQIPRLPSRQPEYTGVKTGTVIIVFAFLIAISSVYVATVRQLTATHAGLFAFLMLAALLVQGYIGETSFRHIVTPLLSHFRGNKDNR